MVRTEEQTLSPIEATIDRYELEQAIRNAFTATLGKEEIVDVYVSRFPHEYGAIVLLKDTPPPTAETVAIEQEEQFRKAGISIGILVRKARNDKVH